MPHPALQDVHFSRLLTEVSVATIQDPRDFFAEPMFPVIPSDHKSDSYFKYDQSDFLSTLARERAPGTESVGRNRSFSYATFDCKVIAVHEDIPDQIRANTDVRNPDIDSTVAVTNDLLIRRDADFARTFLTPGPLNVGPWTHVVPVVTPWNASSSTPIGDILGYAELIQSRTGRRPNRLLLGQRVYTALVNHPEFLDRIKYTQTGVVATDLIARVLDIETVLVSRSVQMLGDGTTDFINGSNALLAYAPSTPRLREPSAGYIFTWRGYLGGNDYGVRVKKFRMEHIETDRIEGSMAYDMEIVTPELGALFVDAFVPPVVP